MADIYENLVREALLHCGVSRIRAFAVNARCLAVQTDCGTGLAYLPPEAWLAAQETGIAGLEVELQGKRLSGIIPRYLEGHPLYTVFALAALNSVFVQNGRTDLNLWRAELRDARRLAMIGDLRPFVNRLGITNAEPIVFELDSVPGTYPPEKAAKLLPSCDAVFITSATFSNKTLHHYLPHIHPSAAAFIFGHGTPMTDVLHDRFTLCGIEVLDPEGALADLRSGKGIRELKRHTRKVIRWKESGLQPVQGSPQLEGRLDHS